MVSGGYPSRRIFRKQFPAPWRQELLARAQSRVGAPFIPYKSDDEDDQDGCASVRVRAGLGRLRADAWCPRFAMVCKAHRIQELTARQLAGAWNNIAVAESKRR
jgi:hypothetical protein